MINFELPSHASTSTAPSTRGAACGLRDERAAFRRLVSSLTLCSAAARVLAYLASFLSDFSFFSIAFLSSRSPAVCCSEWLRTSRVDAPWCRDHQTATSTKAASAVAHVLYSSLLPIDRARLSKKQKFPAGPGEATETNLRFACRPAQANGAATSRSATIFEIRPGAGVWSSTSA